MSLRTRAFLSFVLVILAAAPVAAADVPQDDLSDPPVTMTPAPTGHPWLPIIGPFADESTGFENATAWRHGFAMTRSGDRIAPEIWRSRDGRHWRSSRAPTPAGRIAWVRLWASGAGLVYVQATGEWFTDLTLTFWRSPTGRSWNRLGSLRLQVPARLRGCMLNVEGVGETPTGFAVIADICRSECCGSISPGVTVLAQSFPSVSGKGGVWTWTSAEGRRWTRTRTAGVGTGTLSTITPVAGGLVAALDQSSTASLMRSNDGIAWQPIGAIPPEVDTQNRMHLQPVGDALLFVGDVTDAAGVTSGNVTRAWLVSAAGAWQQVLDLPATFVTATTGDGDSVLLAGVDQGLGDGPDFGWTRLSRDGGRSWETSGGW